MKTSTIRGKKVRESIEFVIYSQKTMMKCPVMIFSDSLKYDAVLADMLRDALRVIEALPKKK